MGDTFSMINSMRNIERHLVSISRRAEGKSIRHQELEDMRLMHITGEVTVDPDDLWTIVGLTEKEIAYVTGSSLDESDREYQEMVDNNLSHPEVAGEYNNYGDV